MALKGSAFQYSSVVLGVLQLMRSVWFLLLTSPLSSDFMGLLPQPEVSNLASFKISFINSNCRTVSGSGFFLKVAIYLNHIFAIIETS